MYQELRLDRITETIRRLEVRIADRFAGRGLCRVARELATVAEETAPVLERVRRPNLYLRTGVGIVILLLVSIPIAAFIAFRGVESDVDGFTALLQTVESGIQDVVYLSVAIYFLLSIEGRRKRKLVLTNLHRLRSIVHVIDMHQLTKDPERVVNPDMDAASSPERDAMRFELVRYLDYCAELLSHCSKLAALHVQYMNDPVVLDAVNDIEVLASGLASRIWQKIMILDTTVGTTGRAAAN